MTAPLLDVSGMDARRGRVEVLRAIDLDVSAGEVLAITGPNGAGKSTLVGAIAGVYPPSAGRVRLAGRDVTGWPAEQIVPLGLCLVPERRQIWNDLTVEEHLILGGYHRYWHDRRGVRADIAYPLRLFPRLGELVHRLGGHLSGGEQQMLAIGRGLMARPRVLLLDEPSLGLAPRVVREIMRTLAQLCAAEGLAVVLVEQNLKAAMTIAGRLCIMERGRIVLRGRPDELLAHPGVRSAYLGKGYEVLG
ncbi:MAG TPA: ABC transporter ATP-binding protein [bacterium]|nr:ABC transporter ATP-binding protein [bacterium]